MGSQNQKNFKATGEGLAKVERGKKRDVRLFRVSLLTVQEFMSL